MKALVTLVLCGLALGAMSPVTAAESPAIREAILAAGNTPHESERLRILRSLEARSDLAPQLRAELNQLLPLVADWAEGRSRVPVNEARAAENGYLCWFITNQVQPSSGSAPVFPVEPAADSPLRPLWALYRGRLLVWRPIQSGPLMRVEETRSAYYGEARRLLREASLAFPDNRVIRMYLGEPIPWPSAHAPDPAAPEWANLQREGLEKLADVVHWWIAERQLPDGQFGGGWGDDVEMWRWWVPVLIAFDDPVITAAQARISNGIFARPHLSAGFTSRLTDVEHSNEDTTDTILPMMHLQPEDPLWQQRALRLTELMRERWTGRNERGFLQFKSIYFSVDQIDESPRRAFDTVYHPSIVQPTLLYWQRTADPDLTALFGEWLKVWVDATARSENGKPAGILPSTLAWPAGTIGAEGAPWWQPFPLNHNDALYNWPGATRLMTSTLLLAWHMTRNEHYLAPIHSMAGIALEQRQKTGDTEPGSLAWSARQAEGFLADTLAKYRFLTGDTRYDALLSDSAPGYVRYRLNGDAGALVRSLRENAEAFRSNREGYTSEMRWTDRVLNFTSNYLRFLPEPAPPRPAPQTLYSSATGDPGNPLIFPLNAVRWRTPPRDIAALVTASGATTFAAELFHFGSTPRPLTAELMLLRPGEYELTVGPASGLPDVPAVRTTFRVSSPRTEVSLELPSRRLTQVSVRALNP